jgi:hypothetical protein
MLVKSLPDNRWLIVNYNYLYLLPENLKFDNESSVRQYFVTLMTDFCKDYEKCNTTMLHMFGGFMTKDMVKFLLNSVKYMLYEGCISQTCDFIDENIPYTLTIDVNEKLEAEILFTSEILDEIRDFPSVSLDDLEVYESEEVLNVINGMSDSVAKECEDKANGIRKSASNKALVDKLSNCDLTLLTDEGLWNLIN